jgi:hypothetical protein
LPSGGFQDRANARACLGGDDVCAARGQRVEQRAGSLIIGKGPVCYGMILWHDNNAAPSALSRRHLPRFQDAAVVSIHNSKGPIVWRDDFDALGRYIR